MFFILVHLRLFAAVRHDFAKVYLKTKKMTDISQTQAGFKAIPHNSKCRYGERGAADAVPQPPKRCLSRQAGIVRCCPMSKTINFLHWLAPNLCRKFFCPKKFLCKQKTAENKNEQKNCPF